MANYGIKNIIVPAASLPGISDDGRYQIRYRIVSEDRNRSSAWSNVADIYAATLQDTLKIADIATVSDPTGTGQFRYLTDYKDGSTSERQAHGLIVGDSVSVVGVDNDLFNIYGGSVIEVINANEFVVLSPNPVDPGVISAGGALIGLNLSLSASNSVILLIWETTPAISTPIDIYVQYPNSTSFNGWSFYKTVTSNETNILLKAGNNQINIHAQASTRNKVLSTYSKLFSASYSF